MRKTNSIFLLIISAFIIFGCDSLFGDKTKSYKISVSSSPIEGGSVSPSTGTYKEGEIVTVTATPSNGWKFVRWEGDWSSIQNPSQLSVLKNYSIVGVFEKRDYPLNITIEGEGTVQERVVTAKSYPYQTVVELTPIPATGWEFSSWGGDLSGSQQPQTITVTDTKNVIARFQKRSYPLNITIVGQGQVEEKVVPSKTYPYQTVVELKAIPATGWEFASWSGDMSGSQNPQNITISGDKTVTATFNELKIVSVKILNPINTLVISRIHKFQVEGTYSNGSKIDLSNQVLLEPNDKKITILDENNFTAGVSGDTSVKLSFGDYETTINFSISNMEYMPITTDLISTANCRIRVPIVIINYFPTKDGVMHDEDVGPSGFWGLYYPTVDQARTKVHSDLVLTRNIVEYGTRFRDYGTGKVEPYVCIDVEKYINLYEIGPYKKLRPEFEVSDPDYKTLFDKLNMEYLVNEKGIKEVWFTIFPKSPEYPTVKNNSSVNDPKTFYNIAESNMSSPTSGDISNSFRISDDLPIYNKTYVVYGYNAHRGPDTNVHNRGHQIESQITWLERRYPFRRNNELFWNNFVGLNSITNQYTGRSGNTHFPPNSIIKDYDYCNSTTVESDIMSWAPSGGLKKPINCSSWTDINYPFKYSTYGIDNKLKSYNKDSHSKWLLFWFQSIPGHNNNIPYVKDGVEYTLTNWWDLFYNWDETVNQGKTLWK